MKQILKVALLISLVTVVGYWALGYFSSNIGWYGYKKWTYRVRTYDLKESKERGVFVRSLSYSVEGFSKDRLSDLDVYIEPGFYYGKLSSGTTVPLDNSLFPFQVSFNHRAGGGEIGLLIRKEELPQFDSTNSSWGYLRRPHLKDTIVLI